MVQQVAWCKWCWIQESVNAILQHLQVVPHHNRTLALRYPHQNLTELGRWNLYWLVNLPVEKKRQETDVPRINQCQLPLSHHSFELLYHTMCLVSMAATSSEPGRKPLLGKPMEYRRWSYMTKLWNSPLQTKDLFVHPGTASTSICW